MNEVTTRQPTQLQSLKALVEKPEWKNRLKEVIGQRAPQFAAAMVQLVNRSYQLQKCTPDSVMGACLTAAALDLSIDPNLGEAHIVPYGDKAQFQIGYIGLGQLAMRSGQYKRLGWKIVYEGELVSWDELSGDLVIDQSKKSSDLVIGYAAKFALLNGFERSSFWTVDQAKKHATRYSASYKFKPKESLWTTDFDKMALKTALKDLLKHWGPKSIQMQKAIIEDQGIRETPDSDITYPDADHPLEISAPKLVEPSPTPRARKKVEVAQPMQIAPPPPPEPEQEPESSNQQEQADAQDQDDLL